MHYIVSLLAIRLQFLNKLEFWAVEPHQSQEGLCIVNWRISTSLFHIKQRYQNTVGR